MIIKKVLFKKNKSNFKNLSEYILDEKNNNAKMLIDYMFDENNDMDKVEGYQFSNCSFDNKEDNIAEILNTQKLNTTSKQDKTMHIVVSFREDEHPSIKTMQAIEKDIAKALGMENHQRLSVVHSNTNNLHIHIAINKINPNTLKVVNPYNDVYILQNAAIEIEKKYNLKVDNHVKNSEKTSKKYDHSFTLSFENWVKESILDKAKSIIKDKNSKFEDLIKLLAEYDLEFKERRNGFCVSSKSEALFCKASSIYRGFSKNELKNRYGDINLQDYNSKTKDDAKKKFEKIDNTKKQSNALWEEYKQIENEKSIKREFEFKKMNLEKQKFRRNKALKTIKKYYFKQKKDQIFKKYKRQSYREFLIEKVMSGTANEDVFAALRQSKPKFEQEDNILYSKKDQPNIFKSVNYVTKEGYAVYKDNKNKMIDKGNFIKLSLQEKNREFLLNSLIMSIDRFGKELNISGSFEFKKEILEIVNEYNLDVKFIDKNMEKVNTTYKERKIELRSKKLLKDISMYQLAKTEAIKETKTKEEISKKAKKIKMLKKILSKTEKSSVAIFEGDLYKLGFEKTEIKQLNFNKKVKMKIDGFYADENNINGLNAMNEEIFKSLSDDETKIEELEKFKKFKYLFEQTNKISDVALGFYENRGIDTDYFIKKFDMKVEKLDKIAYALELSDLENLNRLEASIRPKLESAPIKNKDSSITI